jgi:type 1 fimbriae regulatory protein FimB/type 1 fimbriae regulatory protein FimE
MFKLTKNVITNLPPKKPKNQDRRAREYLTADELELITKAARKNGRHGSRDAAMILIAYRHGLRVGELVSLRWGQVDLKNGLLQVQRLKNGINSTHPLFGPELRALRKIQNNYPDTQYVFISERKAPMTTSTFRKILARAGLSANLDFPIHPHMLRHSTGFKLANDSQDTRTIQQYLGHKNISHTVRYTEILSTKFANFWPD